MGAFVHHEVPTGLIALRGKDRHDLLHRLCTQDCRPLAEERRTARALICTHQGRLLDWIELVETGDALLILCAVGRAQTLIDWLDGFTIMEDVTYRLVGEAVPTVLLVPAAGGTWTGGAQDAPASTTQMGELSAVCEALGLTQVPTPTHAQHIKQGAAETGVLVLRAHPALGPGLRLVPLGGEVELPHALRQQLGAPHSALGWEARRLLAGLPSPEFEYAAPAAPFELRLVQDNVHWHKGCYIGQEVLSRLEAYDKVQRLSMGVTGDEGAELLASSGAKAAKIYVDGKMQGRLTSYVGCGDIVPEAPPGAFVGLATLKREAALAQPAELEIVAEDGEAAAASPPVRVPVTLCARPLWAPSA